MRFRSNSDLSLPPNPLPPSPWAPSRTSSRRLSPVFRRHRGDGRGNSYYAESAPSLLHSSHPTAQNTLSHTHCKFVVQKERRGRQSSQIRLVLYENPSRFTTTMHRNPSSLNAAPYQPSTSRNYQNLTHTHARQFSHAKTPSNETTRDSEEGETVVGSNPSTMKKGHTRRASSITAFFSIFTFPGRRRRTDSTVSEKVAPVASAAFSSTPTPTSPTSTAVSGPSPLSRHPSTSPTKKPPTRSVSVPAETSTADPGRRPSRRFPYLHPLLSRRRGESVETVTGLTTTSSKGKARAFASDPVSPEEPRSRGIDAALGDMSSSYPTRPTLPQKIMSNLDLHLDQDLLSNEKSAQSRFFPKNERRTGINRAPSFSKPLPSIPIPDSASPHAFSGVRASLARSSTQLDAQGCLLPSSAATFGMPSTTSLALTTPEEEGRSSMGVYSIGDPRRSAGMPDDEYIDVTPSIEAHELDSGAVPMDGLPTSFTSNYTSMSFLQPSTVHHPSSYFNLLPSRGRKPSVASISERITRKQSVGTMATAAGATSHASGQSNSRMKKTSTVSLTGDRNPLAPAPDSSYVGLSSQQHHPRRSAKSLSKPSLTAFGIGSHEMLPFQERSRSPSSRQPPAVIPKSKSYGEFKSKSHRPSASAVDPPPLPPVRSKTTKSSSRTEQAAQDTPPPHLHRQSSRHLQQPIRRLPSISSVVSPASSALPTRSNQAPYPLSYEPAPLIDPSRQSSQPHGPRRSDTVPQPSLSPNPPAVELSPPPVPKSSSRTSRSSSTPNSAIVGGTRRSGQTPSTSSTSQYWTSPTGNVIIPPTSPEPVPKVRPASKRSMPALPSTRSQSGWR